MIINFHYPTKAIPIDTSEASAWTRRTVAWGEAPRLGREGPFNRQRGKAEIPDHRLDHPLHHQIQIFAVGCDTR